MARLFQVFQGKDITGAEKVLGEILMCLLIMATRLRRRRWPAVYLGQSLPLPDLALIVKDQHPALVILVAMMTESADTLAERPTWLPDKRTHQHC
jgi:hypothetical protein